MQHLILYDGVCGLCNGFVQFLLKRDKHERFVFAALQSEFAQKLLDAHGLKIQTIDTVVVIENYLQTPKRVLTQSLAVLFVCRQLGGIFRLAGVFYLVPNRLRDGLYDFLAAHRYRWFGKMDRCMMPSKDVSYRFLDSPN